jgi:hypothetical protein
VYGLKHRSQVKHLKNLSRWISENFAVNFFA